MWYPLASATNTLKPLVINTMNATAINGDKWTGERNSPWWVYQDKNGNLYESKEIPVYRIIMDNAKVVPIKGKNTITPITHDTYETTTESRLDQIVFPRS